MTPTSFEISLVIDLISDLYSELTIHFGKSVILKYTGIVREPVKRKIWDYLGVFPNMGGVGGGGGLLNPKTFVI